MADYVTFHESYGLLPKNTLRLIKKFNVSPADYDYMLDILGVYPSNDYRLVDWDMVDEHIMDNAPNGYYRPKY